MKPGWTTVALGDVAEVRRTSVHPAHMRPDDPYLGLENIERGGRLLSVSTVAGEGVRSTKFRFSPGDVLYGKLRPNLAKILKVDFEGLCSTDILPIAVNSGILSADFLAYYLYQPQVVAQAASRASGANLPRLAPAEFLALRIPLPPLDEQRRIAAALDRATVVIGGIGDLRRRTRSIGESVVQQSSTGAGRWSTIGESLTLRSGSTLPATRRRPGGVPVYGANGAIGEHDEATHEQPHVTIGRVGAVGAVNVTAGRAWISDNALIVVKAPEHLSNGYLAIALAMADLGRFASQSAQPLITQRKVADVPLWIPSQAEALRIDAILDRLAEVERANVERVARADALFASLQSRAFRGEL